MGADTSTSVADAGAILSAYLPLSDGFSAAECGSTLALFVYKGQTE